MATRAVGNDLAELPAARKWVADFLSAQGIPTKLAQLAVVLADELVANAITHGAPPIEISLSTTAGIVRCEVADGSNTIPALNIADPTEISGRGIQLVAKLANRWGTSVAGPGKRVWFELDL